MWMAVLKDRSGAAVLLRNAPVTGLNVAAVGVLLLVMIGLHNAWNVTLRMISLTPSGS